VKLGFKLNERQANECKAIPFDAYYSIVVVHFDRLYQSFLIGLVIYENIGIFLTLRAIGILHLRREL